MLWDRPHITAQMFLRAINWPCCLTRFITAEHWRSWWALVVPDVSIDCAFQIIKLCGVSLWNHVSHSTTESVLSSCVLRRQSSQSLNSFAGASSLCFCIRQYFGWHADTGNRDQLLRACDLFFFFLSSTLVTISCKENRSFTKKVWPEEGISGRKCLQLCQYTACVARLVR